MTIEPTELRERLQNQEQINLIDVREEWEWEEKNIGGTLLPLNSIPFRLNEIEPLRDQEVIVFCKSGNRSNQAKIFLDSRGFTNVRSLAGGIEAYLELEKKSDVN